MKEYKQAEDIRRKYQKNGSINKTNVNINYQAGTSQKKKKNGI